MTLPATNLRNIAQRAINRATDCLHGFAHPPVLEAEPAIEEIPLQSTPALTPNIDTEITVSGGNDTAEEALIT